MCTSSRATSRHSLDRTIRLLSTAWALSLIFFVFMALLSEALLESFLYQQDDALEIIHQSGKQSAYSQEIALYASQMVVAGSADGRAQARQDLLTTVQKMRANHEQLAHRRALDETLRRLYFGGPFSLDERLHRYWDVAERFANAPDAQITPDNTRFRYLIAEASALLALLEQITEQRQQLAESHFHQLSNGNFARVALVVAVGLLQALFIARPLVGQARDKARALLVEVRQRERAEQQLRALVNHFPNGLLALFDTDKRHLIVGGSGLAEFDLSQAELEGKTIGELTNKPLIALAESVYNRVLNGETVVTVERDGQQVHLIQAIPVHDQEGIVGGIIMTQNITQQKALEDALREKQRYLDQINRRIPDVICVYDLLEDRVIFSNRPVSALLGYGEDPNPMPDLTEILQPDDYALYQLAKERQRQLNDDEMLEDEYAAHNANGGIAWLHTRTYVFKRAPNGAVQQVISVIQDVTERKRVEETLIESQLFVERITSTMPDLLYIYDLTDKRNVYANRSLPRLLGYSYNEIQKMGEQLLARIMHPDDYAAYQRSLSRYDRAADDEVLESEYRYLHKDGHYRWLYTRETIFARSPDGRPSQILGIAQDITERKVAEDQARQLVLEQERIKMLSNFITATSHELRTPLAVISSSLFILSESPDPDRRKAKIAAIEEQIKRISALLDQMHRLARLDAIHKVDIEPLAVDELLQSAHTQKAAEARQKGVTLTIASLSTAHVAGQATDLTDALAELVDNAIRYTPAGGRVELSAESTEDAVIIRVRDSGRGIPPENLERIFERFFKGSAARTADSSGNGLGLVIVKRIIELHRGSIAADSVEGQGSVFTIHLPKLRQVLPHLS